MSRVPAWRGSCCPAGAALELLQDTVRLRGFLEQAGGTRSPRGDGRRAAPDGRVRQGAPRPGRAALPRRGAGAPQAAPAPAPAGVSPPTSTGQRTTTTRAPCCWTCTSSWPMTRTSRIKASGSSSAVKSAVDGLEIQVPQKPWGTSARERADGGGDERRRGPGGDYAEAERRRRRPCDQRRPHRARIGSGPAAARWLDPAARGALRDRLAGHQHGARLGVRAVACWPSRPPCRPRRGAVSGLLGDFAPPRATTPPIARARCSRCRASPEKCIGRSSTTASEQLADQPVGVAVRLRAGRGHEHVHRPRFPAGADAPGRPERGSARRGAGGLPAGRGQQPALAGRVHGDVAITGDLARSPRPRPMSRARRLWRAARPAGRSGPAG